MNISEIQLLVEDFKLGSVNFSLADRIMSSILQEGDIEKVGKYIESQCDMASNLIPFKILRNSILLFFLNKHEIYLEKIKEVFDFLDSDEDGVLSSKEIE